MKKRTAISNALSLSGRTDLATDFAIYVERQEAIDAATRKLVVECEGAIDEMQMEGWKFRPVSLANALAELKEASK